MRRQDLGEKKLLVHWLASNTESLVCWPGEDCLALHLHALRDVVVRSIRFHFTEGFFGQDGPQALCMIGEAPDISGGKLVALHGTDRLSPNGLVEIREAIPVQKRRGMDILRGTPHDEFWHWTAGLLMEQPIAGPNDIWHWSGKVEIPEGCNLAFMVRSNVKSCVRVQVGGM